MRAPQTFALGFVIAWSPVLADPATAVPVEQVVEFRINGQPEPTTLVVRRDADGGLLLRAEDLPVLRLRAPPLDGVQIEDALYYRLDTSLGAAVQFDAARQTAELTLPAEAFQATRAQAWGADTLPDLSVSRGGFLNYDLFAESAGSIDAVGGIVEAGVFGRFGVGTGSLLGRDDVGGRSLVRLDTAWTLDLPHRLATLRVGDAISASGAWGRSVRFGGVQFGTNFATQPTLVTTPMLTASGTAVVPSTVDVFVNGNRIASEDVPPGPFTIDSVPVISGAGQMQVVVTDALGRQQVISQPYFSGPALLRAGLSEYSFEAGALRDGYGSSSSDYGDAMAAATFRHGFSDRFTGEAHVEAQLGGAAALGVDGALQVADRAILTATAAVGGDDTAGWLAGVGAEHSTRRLNLFARTQLTSRTFAQFGTADFDQRPRQRTFAGFGIDLAGYGNLQLAYARQSYWTGPQQETVGITHSSTLGRVGYLNIVLSQSVAGERATDVFLNWTLPLGERSSAGLSVRHSSAATTEAERLVAVATAQQSLPVGSGIGYQAVLASNDEAQLGLSAQGRTGTVGVQYASRNGTEGWRADASGGLALTGAGVMASRRLDRSFAVVKVADFEGLTVYVENQPVGRTDSQGRVLLDGLRAYERNEISLDPRELPLDAALTLPRVQVTPAFRSGAVIEFPVSRAWAATLRLVRSDGTPVPAGAVVTLGEQVAPVAFDGLLYLEDVAGSHRASAAWAGGRCEFEVRRPADAGPVPDLGTIYCHDATP